MHFVLDQNFPWHVTQLPWPSNVQITPLMTLASHLTVNFDDWQVMREFARRGDVDGFITNDADMLNLSTEMVILLRTQLTLVVTDGVGHNPLRATGLLMVHLREIAQKVSGKPEIYILRPANLRLTRPGEQINKIAARKQVPPNQLITEETKRISALDSSSTSS